MSTGGKGKIREKWLTGVDSHGKTKQGQSINGRLLLHSFNGLCSRTTWVSQHQKSRIIMVKLIWIYWSKR